MLRSLLISILVLASSLTYSQQRTVGSLLNDSMAFDGYTLFAPSAYETTYLVDNCGNLINSWQSEYRPGQSAYLLEDGSLIRTCKISSSFNGGGTGGRIEWYNWDGQLQWGYNYSTSQYHQHHDIEVLPNGNVLILAWELKTQAQGLQAGRDPSRISGSGLWSERIVEVRPIGSQSGDIVWEWHLWDHLVQDFDSFSNNFGDVAEHPELIDINFPYNSASVDWIHANSIDYNPELDQIMISSRDFEEFWIIDHSTTREEAAGHEGGISGKGGDILYRWGNPLAYKRGEAENKVFSLQHDAHWIPEGMPGEGQVMVFNNGVFRVDGPFSSIDIVQPAIDSEGKYPVPTIDPFGPDSLSWSFDGRDSIGFYSPRLANAQRLPNGNTLICIGTIGRFFEITPDGRKVWEYQSPVGADGPVTQGQIPPSRDVFRAYRYGPGYPAFAGRELLPSGPIELDPLPSDCVLWGDTTSTSIQGVARRLDFEVFPNPVTDEVHVTLSEQGTFHFELLTSMGATMISGPLENGRPISCGFMPSGIYFLRIFDPRNKLSGIKKVIVQ